MVKVRGRRVLLYDPEHAIRRNKISTSAHFQPSLGYRHELKV
jgi:hypothetical protein